MMREALSAAILALGLASPSIARAADQYVSRPITLPPLNFAFDAGVGIGHYEPRNDPSLTGAGLNLEGALGITRHLELGLRLGMRGGVDGRALQADNFGRLYDTSSWPEYYGLGGATLANPEFRLTGAVLNAEVVEIALEGRVVMPFAGGTRFGGGFGVPFLFHIARFVRIDTEAYIFIFADDRPHPTFAVPGRLWFQVSNKVWLGPIAAIHHTPADDHVDLLMGFGLGYQIASFLDFKTQFVFPGINHTGGTNAFGFGAGIQIRIE